jgi:hypothetical protein
MNSPNTDAIYEALKRVANTKANHLAFLASPPKEKKVALDLIINSLRHDHFTPVICGALLNPFDFSLLVNGNISYYSLATYTSMQTNPLGSIKNHISLCKANKIPGSSCFVLYSIFVPIIIQHGFNLALAKRNFELLKYMSDNYLLNELLSPITSAQLSSFGKVVPSLSRSIIADKLETQWHFIITKL